jgi:predicted DNA-binding ribbon-helix-helix protein
MLVSLSPILSDHNEFCEIGGNERKHGNLSSAIRLFVLDHYRRLAELKRKEE